MDTMHAEHVLIQISMENVRSSELIFLFSLRLLSRLAGCFFLKLCSFLLFIFIQFYCTVSVRMSLEPYGIFSLSLCISFFFCCCFFRPKHETRVKILIYYYYFVHDLSCIRVGEIKKTTSLSITNGQNYAATRVTI